MKKVDPALSHRVPPGQTLTAKWPVLTYGLTPRFDPARWTFRCFGLVEHETSWTWAEFLKLPRVTVTSDIHCVTRWSKLDNVWEGVPIAEIVSRVRPLPEAMFVNSKLEDIDIPKLKKKMGKIDLILASPECTNHSPAKGNKPRCEESKNTAFQVIRFAKAFEPRWIVIENVVSMRRWSRYKEFKRRHQLANPGR